MKWLDLPPIWLAAAAFVTWHLRGPFFGLSFGNGAADWIGGGLVAFGIGLMILAVLRMHKHRTTVVPHMEPDALVDDGIFAYTRNPIYLGDAIVLAGLVLHWDAIAAIPIIILFIWIIQKRFILVEEARLLRHFGANFTEYTKKTRRWV